MKQTKKLNLLLLIALFSPLSFGGNPSNTAECNLDGKESDKKITLHFETFETSVWTPKEKEPIYMDYNEDIGKYTVCQKKSPYVSKFLSSFQNLLKSKTFNQNSLSGSLNPTGKKMSLNILSSPYVCVSYSKKGYEYAGAFVLSHEKNRFPNPSDNGYELLFLPLSGSAKDGDLKNPTIESFSQYKMIADVKNTKSTKKSIKRTIKKLTQTYVKPKIYGCRSMGGGQSESEELPSSELAPDLENTITEPDLAE